MASTSSSQGTLPGIRPQDPRERSADHRDRRRDALAFRSPDLELSAPRALDAEAECLQAMGEPLSGVASLFAGSRAPEHFRAALRGERHLWLVDLCRLATSPQHEAREAVRGIRDVLDRLVGDLPQGRLSIVDSAINASEAGHMAHAEATRALADGEISDVERSRMLKQAATLRRTADEYEAAARGGLR